MMMYEFYTNNIALWIIENFIMLKVFDLTILLQINKLILAPLKS